MAERRRWETRKLRCPEGDHTATLLIEWEEDGEGFVIQSIHCDNPKLRNMEHWDWHCRWSCWKELEPQLEA